MPEDPQLEAAIERAFAALEAAGGDLDRLGEPDRTVVVVTTAQGLIDNGGLRSLFESDFPGAPTYAFFAATYRRIGAEDVARAIEQAAARFPFPDPHLHPALRNAWFTDHEGRGADPLDDLDDVACGDAGVWRALSRYAAAGAGS